VIMEYQFAGSSASTKGNFTSVRVAPVLKQNFPEVESAIKMTQYERVVRYKEKMDRYAQLFRALDPHTPIKIGLYYPLMNGWREWEA